MENLKSKIKFTVIIPTRERSDTLKWSLKTCTEQQYDNFQIIVSDNFSQDNTRATVEANKDPRIQYINTGERISMSSNYEFALSHVTGDYVCIIGDDDGLMPGALQDLNKILLDTKIEAISWKKPVYIWNEHSTPELKNTLRGSLKSTLRKHSAEKAVADLLAFKQDAIITFNDLACLYHGFVKVDTINRLRLPDGRFFNSMLPDVYASLVISCAVEDLYQSALPYTLHGISKHSTGYASKDSRSVKKFLSETDIPSHPNIKIVPICAPVCIADCFLKIRDSFPKARRFEMDVKNMLRKAMEDAAALSVDNYKSVVDCVIYIGEAYNIQEYADQVIIQNPRSPIANQLIMTGYDFINDLLILKFNENVRNIYDATLIYKKILGKKAVYIQEASRYLLNYTKNYGVKNIISKGIYHGFRLSKYLAKTNDTTNVQNKRKLI